MKNVSRINGFSLLEFVAVLALLSGALLTYSQLQSTYHRQQLQNHLLDSIVLAKTALYQHYGTHNQFPSALQDIMSLEQIRTPWNESLYLQHAPEGVALVTPTPDEKVQAWLLARLVNSELDNKAVFIHLPKPIQTLSSEYALHRVAVPERPELNTMNVDLDMGGHNLLGFDLIEANQATLGVIEAETAFLKQLNTKEITAELLMAQTASFEQVQVELLEVNELAAVAAEFTVLEISDAYVDVLEAGSMQVQQVDVNTLKTAHLEVDSLIVSTLHADDIVTPLGSLTDAQQRLQNLELAWLECLASGGCQ